MESDSGKATLTNCFKRSLMFKTVAHLIDMDSGMLFLKGVVAKYLIFLLIIELGNLLCGKFDIFEVLISMFIGTLIELIVSTPFTLLLAFIFNLFLADSFMKVANIICFSRVYSPLLDGLAIAFSEDTLSKNTFASILGFSSMVIFVVLLVKNIRALKNK